MAKSAEKMNPFERKVVRPKFSVLGRNLKEIEKTAGQSRQVATEARKSTLLKEYQQLGKANKFVDQRIGEKDKSLTKEDKLLQRFQKERQARFKKSDVFNLEEDDLTHMGTSLSKIDDFGDDFADSSEDDGTGHLDAELVSALHFGGGEEQRQTHDESKRKSKREIMDELIAKSKFFKAERQKEKRENEELTDQLDDAWRGLLKKGAFSGMVRDNKQDPTDLLMKSLERAKKGEKGLESAQAAAEAFDSVADDKKDDFNVLFRELAFEMKGRATDRLKTPEEIAKEQKERLEQLERERLRRMQGDVSDDESDDLQDEEGEEEEGEEGEEGDEDEDAVEVDEEDASSEDNDEERSEDETNEDEVKEAATTGEADEETVRSKKRKADADANYFLEPELDEGDEEDEEGESMEGRKEKKRKRAKTAPVYGEHIEDLPFTFEMPQNHKAFLAIVDGRDSTQLDVVVHRMRVCHDLSLSPENRGKIERLIAILYDHFLHVGKATSVDMSALDVLTKHLFQLSQAMPDPSARAARERLTAAQQALHKRLSTVQLSGRKGAWPWPAVEELFFLKLISVIFPTTDFQHTVVTPASLFIGQALAQCPLSNPLHAAAGLFMATLSFHYLQGTDRMMPEALFFLNDLLSLSLVSNLPSLAVLQSTAASFVREISTEPFLRLTTSSGPSPSKKSRKPTSEQANTASADAESVPPFDFLAVFSRNSTDSHFSQDTFKLQVANTCLRLLSQFSTHCYQNNELQSYPELFYMPYSLVSKFILTRRVPQLQAILQETKAKLGTSIKRKVEQRLPLRQKRKPTPIRMLNPRFKENFKPGRDNDPDRERAEKKKFDRMYKKELKGAIRELRKDTAFLQAERERKKARESIERTEKTKRVMNILAMQEGDFKKMERLKKQTTANSSSVL